MILNSPWGEALMEKEPARREHWPPDRLTPRMSEDRGKRKSVESAATEKPKKWSPKVRSGCFQRAVGAFL